MKKIFTKMLICVLCLTAAFMCACVNNNGETPGGDPQTARLTFYTPDGAPALGVAKFIADNENFGEKNVAIDYNVVSADTIATYINGANGYGDFVVMPINAASKLYKKNAEDPYKMAAVVTHGNLYIMTTEKGLTLDGLVGKTVGVIGQGLVPDLTLRAALGKAGLADKVVTGESATEGKITFRYFSNAQEMMPLLKKGVLTTGLLPEPAATNLEKNVAKEKDWERLDVQELYDAESRSYPQAVLMVKSSVLSAYPNLLTVMAEKFAAGAEWVRSNPADAVNAINGNVSAKNPGLTPSLSEKTLNAAAISGCNIFWQAAASAKAEVKAYIAAINAIDLGLGVKPAAPVGDDFFA